MKKKTKNTITAIATFTFLFSMCGLDSPTWMPTISLAVSLAWIAFVVYTTDFESTEEI